MSFQARLTAPVGPGDRRPEFRVGESFSGCLSPKWYQGELISVNVSQYQFLYHLFPFRAGHTVFRGASPVFSTPLHARAPRGKSQARGKSASRLGRAAGARIRAKRFYISFWSFLETCRSGTISICAYIKLGFLTFVGMYLMLLLTKFELHPLRITKSSFSELPDLEVWNWYHTFIDTKHLQHLIA